MQSKKYRIIEKILLKKIRKMLDDNVYRGKRPDAHFERIARGALDVFSFEDFSESELAEFGELFHAADDDLIWECKKSNPKSSMVL